jgi:multiple sugar transport system permease protein
MSIPAASPITVPVTPHARTKTRPQKSDRTVGLLFALPQLILFIVFLLVPTVYGFWISLHHWHILAKTHPFVGLNNYGEVFSDDIFWMAVRNTVYFVVLVVPAGNLVSLLLALGLVSLRRFQTFYKIVFYLPVIISIAVVATLWQWLYNTDIGLLNLYLGSIVGGLRHLGLPLPPFTPVPWLSSPGSVMPSVALMSVWWGAGGNMILYLAGLNNIPDDYMEAAQIDGAGAWQRFWGITWPLLKPTTLFCLVFSVLGAFQVFGQTYVLYGGGSGPGRAGLTLALYMYQQGFGEYQIGYGTAVAYVLFAIVLLLTLVQFRLLSKGEGVR